MPQGEIRYVRPHYVAGKPIFGRCFQGVTTRYVSVLVLRNYRVQVPIAKLSVRIIGSNQKLLVTGAVILAKCASLWEQNGILETFTS